MKAAEIIAVGAALITGCCLALIQLRRIISGELSLFGCGFQNFIEAARIKIDKFDKRLLLVAGISFLVCIVFAVISYS